MVNYEPKPIKSYYIAYLDILGYREFFHNYPDKTAEFLQMIHASIQGTINKITGANQSVLAASIASMNIDYKILTRCNCDPRFLKMKIEVLEEQMGTQTNGNQPNT